MQKLSLEQQQQLNSWLLDKSPAGTLSLTAVKGYFFAIICSPDDIPVEQWLAGIFNHQIEALPDEITMTLATLYNEVSHQIFESQMFLPEGVEFSDEIEANFLSGHPLHEWSLGFTIGMAFYSEKFINCSEVDEELLESFSIALMAFTFFNDRANAQQVVEQQEDSNINNFGPLMYGLITDFLSEFAQLVEQVALSSGLYDDNIDDWD